MPDPVIPTRVVGGFARGEVDGDVRYFREGHRHAWGEVPISGYGWVPFEATPPNVGSGGGTGGVALAVALSGESAGEAHLPDRVQGGTDPGSLGCFSGGADRGWHLAESRLVS